MSVLIFFFFFKMNHVCLLFFFFQAEDGIRDFHVTGVQTCALPISAATTWSRPRTSTRRWSWPPRSRAPATGRSRSARSWSCRRGRPTTRAPAELRGWQAAAGARAARGDVGVAGDQRAPSAVGGGGDADPAGPRDPVVGHGPAGGEHHRPGREVGAVGPAGEAERLAEAGRPPGQVAGPARRAPGGHQLVA